jgi:hypothetical protein
MIRTLRCPTNPNQHPNQHDWKELETIYSHLDSTNTTGSVAPRGNGFDTGRGFFRSLGKNPRRRLRRLVETR